MTGHQGASMSTIRLCPTKAGTFRVNYSPSPATVPRMERKANLTNGPNLLFGYPNLSLVGVRIMHYAGPVRRDLRPLTKG